MGEASDCHWMEAPELGICGEEVPGASPSKPVRSTVRHRQGCGRIGLRGVKIVTMRPFQCFRGPLFRTAAFLL